MQITYGNGGWVGIADETLPGSAYLRLRPDKRGRLRVFEVYVDGDEPVTPDLLRRLPIQLIEDDAARDPMVKSLAKTVGVDLSRLASHFGKSFGRQADHWVADSLRAQFDDGAGRQAPYGPRPAERLGKRAKRRKLQAPERLDETFWHELVEAYADVVAQGLAPAPILAEEAGVSERTVHRWVYQARRRGYMPPGRQGKTGWVERGGN